MKERVKELRKALKSSQESFGEKLGITKASISRLESGVNNLTEPMIKLICSTFNVNEEWLRTGEGEMFAQADTFSLDEYARKNNLSALELDIVRGYIELDRDTRQTLVSHFKAIFDKHSEVAATVDTYVPYYEPIPAENYYVNENEIDEEVERYRLELQAEKKGETSSVYGDIKESQAK